MTDKPKLFLLHLEPLEERYTGQWWDWLPETFGQAFDVVPIGGRALTDTVEVGAFLDLNSTFHWKATQLQAIAYLFHKGAVKDGDAFWFSDIEFPGMESVRYLARLAGIDVKVFGFLHAGSYTRGDFFEPMADIGQWAELAWAATCDRIYVGSEYHKEAFHQRRLPTISTVDLLGRIVVTGNPWRTMEALALDPLAPASDQERIIDVLFPHRPDEEKGIRTFLKVIDGEGSFKGEHILKTWRVTFTTGRTSYRSTNAQDAADRVLQLAEEYPNNVRVNTCLTRKGFYSLLRQAKVVVSCATEENFGYAMVEAFAHGAHCLMPDCASYPELARGDHRFLYPASILAGGIGEEAGYLRTLIDRAVRGYHPDGHPTMEDRVKCAAQFDGAEQRILEDMVATCAST